MNRYLRNMEHRNVMLGRYRQFLFPLLGIILLTSCSLPISLARIRKGDLAQYTTPLESETIHDICLKFELNEDKRCEPGQIVYAPDFFPIVLDYYSGGEFTREDVVTKLGRYEYDCEKPIYVPSLDKTYYTCSYDFNGDKVFPIGIFFDIEEYRHLVTRVIATIGDN